jgi:hypothetical protein
MFTRRLLTIMSLLVLTMLSLSAFAVQAGDVILSDNTGDGNTEWFISGEASLVMNGFDLSKLNVQLPVALDKVSIAVKTPTPGTPIDVVVYQDANGGSPSDAALAGSTQIDISQTGVVTIALDPPIIISQPVIWVGFYLPVDFRFLADTSGTSVLTYWAWTSGGRFDLANLSSAAVLGPADGTSPVNIDLKGVARITAEIRTASDTEVATADTVAQITGSSTTNLAPLQSYPFCPVLIDTDDVTITLSQKVAFYCSVTDNTMAPATPVGFERRGFLFDIFVFGETPSATKLPKPVTHCIRPAPEDLNTAVLGVAFGTPRQWQILPSQRYGDAVCAELAEVGFLAYFVRTVVITPTPAA